MHLIADRSSQYFKDSKYMNDYSICFDESMYLDSSIKTKNVKGRFSKENYEMNQQFTSIAKFK